MTATARGGEVKKRIRGRKGNKSFIFMKLRKSVLIGLLISETFRAPLRLIRIQLFRVKGIYLRNAVINSG